MSCCLLRSSPSAGTSCWKRAAARLNGGVVVRHSSNSSSSSSCDTTRAEQPLPRASSYASPPSDLEEMEAEPPVPHGLDPYLLPHERKQYAKPNWANLAPPLLPLPRSKPLKAIFVDENGQPQPYYPAPEQSHRHRQKRHPNYKQLQQQHQQHPSTVAEVLQRQTAPGQMLHLPPGPWVHISDIPPLSSMESMLQGVDASLDAVCSATGGIIDLDAPYNPSGTNSVPFVTVPQQESSSAASPSRWVNKARLHLSPFGRPTGWYLQLTNRSVACALLEYSKTVPLKCAWKPVNVNYSQGPTQEYDVGVSVNEISDCTVRMEQVEPTAPIRALAALFTRFDLGTIGHYKEPVVPWSTLYYDNGGKAIGNPVNGRVVKVPQNIYLLNFASPAWARAAVREQQGLRMKGHHNKVLKLAQYPRQIL